MGQCSLKPAWLHGVGLVLRWVWCAGMSGHGINRVHTVPMVDLVAPMRERGAPVVDETQ